MDKVSIIVPVFNSVKYLKACLESLAVQTYKNTEIIIVDDGSTDGSVFLYESFIENHYNARAIRQENEGVASARNHGMKMAAGDWIAFVDSDDYVHKNYIYYMKSISKQEKCDIVQCGYMSTDTYKKTAFGAVVKDTKTYSQNEMQWGLCGVSKPNAKAWGKLFKRSLFMENYFPKGKMHEDEGAMYKLFANANKMACTSTPLYFYSSVNDSLTNQRITVKNLDIIDILLQKSIFYKNKELELLYNATIQKAATEIAVLFRKFSEEANYNQRALRVLQEKYRLIWLELQNSPLLSPEKKELHLQWANNLSYGQTYSVEQYMDKLYKTLLK